MYTEYDTFVMFTEYDTFVMFTGYVHFTLEDLKSLFASYGKIFILNCN